MIEKVNLAEKLSLFKDHWSPKIVGEVNDFCVKLVKLQGEFVCGTTTTKRTSCFSWSRAGFR